jgi:hypothetical protein
VSESILRYPNGQQMPSNVVSALLLTGKVGFLSRDLWNHFFGEGTDRWHRQQIAHLVDRGYLQKHSNPEAKSTFVLTRKGIEFVGSINGSIVTPPPVTYLTHDGVVAKSLMELQEGHYLNHWVCERELKRDGAKEYLVSSRQDGEFKYPDAVFEIHAFGKLRTVALEYERERKSLSRYKNILWQYSGLTNVSMVLFVYQKPSIKTTIEAAMSYLGDTGLSDRLAFADAEDWKCKTDHAEITLKTGKIKLAVACKRFEGKVAA